MTDQELLALGQEPAVSMLPFEGGRTQAYVLHGTPIMAVFYEHPDGQHFMTFKTLNRGEPINIVGNVIDTDTPAMSLITAPEDWAAVEGGYEYAQEVNEKAFKKSYVVSVPESLYETAKAIGLSPIAERRGNAIVIKASQAPSSEIFVWLI